MTKKKTTIQLNPEIGKAIVHETGLIMQEVIKGGTKIGDRFIQASLSSPYYSWAAIALLTSMGVRAKLWPADTSNLVTGTGLALLGLTTVENFFPVLSGFIGSEKMIDNKWDLAKGVISPWAIESDGDLSVSELEDILIKLKT